MTQEELEQLKKKAGVLCCTDVFDDYLKRFAALVSEDFALKFSAEACGKCVIKQAYKDSEKELNALRGISDKQGSFPEKNLSPVVCEHTNQSVTHYSNETWIQHCESCGVVIKSGTYINENGAVTNEVTTQQEPVVCPDCNGSGEMKTVIEMAREAGFPFNKYGLLCADENGEIDADEMFERFAAIVREDGREKQQEPVVFKQGNLASFTQDEYPALGNMFIQLWDGDDVAARVYGNTLNQIQQRINILNTATTPPTAAIAARQMRDAAVKAVGIAMLGADRDLMKRVIKAVEKLPIEGEEK